MKKTAIALGLILASTLLSLTGAEFILRFNFKFPQPQFLTIDPVFGHKHRPDTEGYFTREGLGFVRINRYGFRDKDYTIDRNSKKRIAVLGDSYTEAFQVNLNQTFHGLLESEFEDTLEVLNFGVSGYGTGQELLAYRHAVRQFQPDIVVLAFYPGNDIQDNSKDLSRGYLRPYFSLNNDKLELDSSFQESRKHKRSQIIYDAYYFLTDNSIIFSLLDQLRYYQRPEPKKMQNGNTKEVVKNGSDLLYKPESKKHLDAWLLTERLILELANEVELDGGKFVLFVQDSMPGQLLTKDNKYYVEDRLGEFCDYHSLLCTFMAPTAIGYNLSTGPLHGFNGANKGHWNQTGHRIAYSTLKDTLLNQKLLP